MIIIHFCEAWKVPLDLLPFTTLYMIFKILHIKKTQIHALALEAVVHVARVVALVQAKLKKRKIANAQPWFF